MSRTVQGIRTLLDTENQRIAFEVGYQVFIGCLICLMVYGFTFIVFLIPGVGIPRPLSSLLITLAVVALTVIGAWRKVNPLEGVDPLTVPERQEMAVREAIGVYSGSPRFTAAGLGMLFLAGPNALFSAWRDWRRRRVYPPEVVQAAAALLEQCQKAVSMAEAEGDPARLLLQLRLAKVTDTYQGQAFITTDKGRFLVAGNLTGAT